MTLAFGCHHPTQAEIDAAPSMAGHGFAAAIPPATLDRSGINFVPILGHNDTDPVCTVVALCNAMLAVEAANNNSGLPIDQEKVRPFYALAAGCENTQAAIIATDGTNPLNVLRGQLAGFDCGLQTPAVGLFGVLPTTRTAVANAMDRLRAAYVAIDLFDRDMDDFEAGRPWADLRDPGRLVSGHLILPFDYLGLRDGDTGRCATWGVLHPFSWEWLVSRMRFAAGLAYRFLGTAGALDAGGDLLEAELRSMVA